MKALLQAGLVAAVALVIFGAFFFVSMQAPLLLPVALLAGWLAYRFGGRVKRWWLAWRS